MAITIADKVQALNAGLDYMVRNTNVDGDDLEEKAGPAPVVRVTDTDVRALVEGLNDESAPSTTNVMHYYKSTDRGMSWSVPGGVTNPLFAPSTGAENGEVCITSLFYDADLGRWVAFFHYGNNLPGVRKIGCATTVSLESPSWTRTYDLIVPSAFGTANDDCWVADAFVVKVGTGDYRMLYRGVKNAGSSGSPSSGVSRIFYATASSPTGTWTKYNTTGVLVPSGSELSVSSPGGFVDANGRVHLWYAIGTTTVTQVFDGVSYAYSDNWTSWTKGASNPVWVNSGTATRYDYTIGDTVNVWRDSDLVFINATGFNNTGSLATWGSPARSRFEGRVQAWVPLPSEGPTRGGRHYRSFSGASTQFSALPSTVQVFNHSTFIVYGEFKCPKHNTPRQFFTAQLSGSFRQEINVGLTTAGLARFYVRSDVGTTLTELQATSTAGTRYDDNKRRWFLLRRTSASAVELIVGDETGSSVVASASGVSPSLTTGTTYPAFGNFHTSGTFVPGNEPTFGTLGGAILVLGGTITAADALAFFNSRTVPTPSGGTLHRWQLGGSSTTTEDDLGAGTAPLTHTGSPVRVEWTAQADLVIPTILGGGHAVRRRRRLAA